METQTLEKRVDRLEKAVRELRGSGHALDRDIEESEDRQMVAQAELKSS